MHPRTSELLDHLDATRAQLRVAVDSVPPELRETRPAPDRWSVAEVLEHLARVEGRLTKVLGARLGEAREAGTIHPDPSTDSILARLDQRLLLDRSRRIVAGEHVLPPGELTADAAWGRLAATRPPLRDLVVAYDGLDIGVVSLPHPALGPLDAHLWFAFIGTHELRHADQIREAGAAVTP